MKKSNKIDTTWELWSYDVWGNKKDGYEVNDRNCFNRAYPITLKIQTFNKETQQEFDAAYPSDYQIKKLFGVSCKISTTGDDTSIYIERESDGFPIGEMFCTSHKCLSPITYEFKYIIDLDERGVFRAHVENESGKILFNISNEETEIDEEGNEHTFDGALQIVQDGYMKHTEDVDGLLKYLVNDLKILPSYSILKI